MSVERNTRPSINDFKISYRLFAVKGALLKVLLKIYLYARIPPYDFLGNWVSKGCRVATYEQSEMAHGYVNLEYGGGKQNEKTYLAPSEASRVRHQCYGIPGTKIFCKTQMASDADLEASPTMHIFPSTLSLPCPSVHDVNSTIPSHGSGAAAEQWLKRSSPPTAAIRARYPAGSLPDPRMRESCWTMPLASGLSRGTVASPAPAFHSAAPSKGLISSNVRGWRAPTGPSWEARQSSPPSTVPFWPYSRVGCFLTSPYSTRLRRHRTGSLFYFIFFTRGENVLSTLPLPAAANKTQARRGLREVLPPARTRTNRQDTFRVLDSPPAPTRCSGHNTLACKE
ncbi:hypothetical protein PR048_007688 [Dryococelus australis]|uniref:Uncharacterized protein n=1 Tax=Dryococelus australis TaxID=614101 RepID=A0ABQ9HVU4_9NEOP|nr:hypothetical protein PR048_007688 [Dryococelus australis]